MITNLELLAMAQEKHMQFIGAERASVCMLLDICRRDTWASATKAQMENDYASFNRWKWDCNDDEKPIHVPCPFPGDPT